MSNRKYNRIYNWEDMEKLPRTNHDDLPQLTDPQNEWCFSLRDNHRERPRRLVQAAGMSDRFPGALTVIITEETNVNADPAAFPSVALDGTPDSIEVVYVRMPITPPR